MAVGDRRKNANPAVVYVRNSFEKDVCVWVGKKLSCTNDLFDLKLYNLLKRTILPRDE